MTRDCSAAANVVNLEKEAGKAFSFDELSKAVTQHKPAVLFLCQVGPQSDVAFFRFHFPVPVQVSEVST